MFILLGIGYAIAGIGSAVAAAGSALAVTAGALAAGNLGLAAASFGALLDTSIVGSFTLGTALEFGALYGASALLAPTPKVNTAGSPQAFKADPYAPIPLVMARYGVGSNLVYETTSGGGSKAEHGAAGNEYLTQFALLGGLGPYPGVESTRLDDTVLTFAGQTCTGGYIQPEYIQSYNPGYKQNADGTYANNNYKDHVWQVLQLGAQDQGGLPYPSKIVAPGDSIPEWTAAHGFNGFAALSITRSYDTSVWAGGAGQPQWTLSGGYPCYDPRKDSTYPGGNGPHRWCGAQDSQATLRAARATWEPSDNAIIHALNYALGFYLPDPLKTDPAALGGLLYAGVGAGKAGVDVDAFVHAANVADANAWSITGSWTTGDGKRSVLTAMLQTASAQLVSSRGRISCTISAPLTALNPDAPLTWADMAGPITVDTGTSVREKINTVFYRYISEAHRWQIVQADTPVEAQTYVDEDGEVRSKSLDLPYVPNVDQGAQISAYAIVDARETPNIVLPGKPHLRGYDVGDALIVDLPEVGLHLAKLVVLKRKHDPGSGMVTLTCRTETDAKHTYAMGLTGTAPATPSISGYDPSIVPAPIPASWTAAPAALADQASGEVVYVVRINGTTIDNVYASSVVVSYAKVTTVGGADVTGPYNAVTFDASVTQIDLHLAAGRYHVTLRYITVAGAQDAENVLDLGVITVAADVAANVANVGDRTAAQVLADIDTNATTTAAEILRGGAREAYNAALLYLDGVPVGTVLTNFQGQQSDANASYSQSFQLLGSKNVAGTAWTFNGDTTYVDADTTLAEHLTYVKGVLGDGTTSIASIDAKADGQSGRIALAVNAAGQISGIDVGASNVPNSGYIDLVTSKLRLVDDSGVAKTVLLYTGGKFTFSADVEIDGGLSLKGQSVDTGQLAPTAATDNMTSTASALTPGSGAEDTIFTHTFQLDRAARLVATGSVAFQDNEGGHAATSHTSYARLYINGAVVGQAGVANNAWASASQTVVGSVAVPAGTATVKLTAQTNTYDAYTFRTLVSELVKA